MRGVPWTCQEQPAHLAAPHSRRHISTRCAAHSRSGCEVSICQNKTCKKQGSKEILQFAKDLHMEGVTVRSTGCLGVCGNGPNIAVSPPDVVLNHIATPAKFAEAMRAVAGADVSEAVLRTTELRLAGNALARQGDLQGACARYTEALDQESNGRQRHLLLANRSGARLSMLDHTGALHDADAAADCCPDSFHTAYVRQIEAHAALKDYAAAEVALVRGGKRDPAFQKTKEYKSLEKQLRKLNRQPVAV